MAAFALSRALLPRAAIIAATAVAMLLPLPARCAACSTSAGNCPRCDTANTDRQPVPDPSACCKHRSADRQTPAADAAHHVSQHSPQCGCGVHPPQRTKPSTERVLDGQDLTASPTEFASSSVEPRLVANFINGSILPPPIPHRILHCSWLI
jgi:hypothetical protein